MYNAVLRSFLQNVDCRAGAIILAAAMSAAASMPLAAEMSSASRPSFDAVKRIVTKHLETMVDYQEGDIIAYGDVEPIFRELAKRGWKVVDQKAIQKQMLDDNHFLVRQLRTPEGRRLMRKISKEKNIYDRLDRVAEHDGGQALIRKIIELPGGDKYAKANPGVGNPNLSDLVLISERGSAHKRKLKDYDKPTGMIYTQAALLDRLKESYSKAK